MTRILDVTLPLSPEVPTLAGDPRFCIERLAGTGRSYRISRMTLGTHTGTHVDAPLHFVADGAGVDELPLEILTGKSRVAPAPRSGPISRADLEALDLRDDLRLLIRTRTAGVLAEADEPAYLSDDAATYLVQAGLKLVGIDTLSVDAPDSRDFPAHHILLRAGVVIVEGLELSDVEPGEYDLSCLPLRIQGGDGAPARVVLRTR